MRIHIFCGENGEQFFRSSSARTTTANHLSVLAAVAATDVDVDDDERCRCLWKIREEARQYSEARGEGVRRV